MTPRLTVVSSTNLHTGYGRHGMKLAAALADLGVDVQHVGTWKEPQRIDGDVLFVTIPSMVESWRRGQRLHLLTMIEGTRVFDEWVPMLAAFDTIIVPSLDCREAFSAHHSNVQVAFEGIDPDEWKPTPRRPVTTEFRFCTAGTGQRKGGDIVAEAFRRAFPHPEPGRPVPRLLIRSARVDYPVPAAAQVISSRLSAEEERDFYAEAHCWVQPSRGEGFGLMPLQAIAQGCPTILTGAHGHRAYAHLGIPVPASRVKAGYFMFGDAGDWWEPDVDAVAARMRHVYDNYPDVSAEAWEKAKIAHSEWRWDQAAREVLAALGGHKALSRPYRGDGAQVKAPLFRYALRVQRPWQAEIADTRYLFEPGRTYYETADVKRVLAAAGALDPSCLGEGGLDARLVEASTAASATCPTCSQPINKAVPV